MRDGVLNKGAIDFNIPVASDRESLHFLWWNGDFSSNVPYKIIVKIKDPEVMYQPSLNISHSGQVPKMPTYWRMSLPCNNLVKGQAKVDIDFDLGSNLQFSISRLKHCEPEIGEIASKESQGSKGSSTSWSSHLVFVYSLLIAFIIALILGILVAIMQKKYESKLLRSSGNFSPNLVAKPVMIAGEDPSPLLPAPNSDNFQTHVSSMPNPVAAGFTIYDPMTSDAESRVTDWIQQQYMKANNSSDIHHRSDESTSYDVKTPDEVAKDIQVDRSRLKLGSLLQEGTFGKVYQGRFSNEDSSEEITEEEDVMIKTVMSWSSSMQSQLLVIEGVKLAGLNHKHILSPWAMTWDGSSPMFIYPYVSLGNLKQYLTKYAQAGLSTHQIVKHGVQILAALSHLHKRKLVHRDIATRNTL